MKLIVWTPAVYTGEFVKAFKKSLSFYFLKRTYNDKLLLELNSLIKDCCFFIVSGFFEIIVNLYYCLPCKARKFEKQLKAKIKQNGANLLNINFYDIFLEVLKTKPILLKNKENLSNVLIKGNPVLIVSNHPYPPVDGLMLMSMVYNYRQDFAILVNSNNSMLSLYPEFTNNVIGVHMSEGLLRTRDSELVRKSRISALKKIFDRLNSGHCVIILPAGQGSKAKAWGEEIKDIEWINGVALIVKRFVASGSELTILPIFIEGHMGGGGNSQYYQKAVIESPMRLCSALQRAFFNAPPTININIGNTLTKNDFINMTELEILQKMREMVYCQAKDIPKATRC